MNGGEWRILFPVLLTQLIWILDPNNDNVAFNVNPTADKNAAIASY